jgi:hypothetical protein
LGGFIPICHTQTFVEVAKQERIMSSIERRRRPEKFQNVHYPYVVLPILNGWEVRLTGIDKPYRVADFGTKDEAYEFADIQNDLAYFEREAWFAAKMVIDSVMKRTRLEVLNKKTNNQWCRLTFWIVSLTACLK